MKKRIIEIAVKVVVAALTAFLLLMQFPDAARMCLDGDFLAVYV